MKELSLIDNMTLVVTDQILSQLIRRRERLASALKPRKHVLVAYHVEFAIGSVAASVHVEEIFMHKWQTSSTRRNAQVSIHPVPPNLRRYKTRGCAARCCAHGWWMLDRGQGLRLASGGLADCALYS